MKQHEQCVESWWAIRIGKWNKNQPYFYGSADGPLMFRTKGLAQAWIRNRGLGSSDATPVRVVVATLGETQ